MKTRSLLTMLAILGLLLVGPGLNPVQARTVLVTEDPLRELTVTLEAGPYALRETSDGEAHIDMEQDFGSFGAPGEPQLPGRVFLIALPPGAEVIGVHFATPAAATLPGQHRIVPVGPTLSDPQESDRALSEWEAKRERAYASDQAYPNQVAGYLGQHQWRRYTYARVAYQPFSYQPLSGALRFHPTVAVTIQYRLPEAGTSAWREVQRLADDRVLDDVIARYLVNFDQAQAWYAGTTGTHSGTAGSLHDYVIIVPDEGMINAVAPLKAWKETLGHTVQVVTLAWIEASYPTGADMEEHVWYFLHDKYPLSEWGIRYVLLVGDMQALRTPRVYFADTGWGLRSDHFYAKVSGGDTIEAVWNQDGDVRWGELDDDHMTVEPDVLVGRIPLNDAAEVGQAIQATIAFEQDYGTWKHNALLAGGYSDIASATTKTDSAVVFELVREQLLDPGGWAYTRLYEQTGLGTSTYTPPPDGDANPTSVVAAWNETPRGFVVLSDHGAPDGLSGHVWDTDSNANGKVDDGEWVWSGLFNKSNVPSLPTTHPSLVALMGCQTIRLVTPPWPIPDQSKAPPGGYTDNTGSDLLATGAAVGVIGNYTVGPYIPYWDTVSDGGAQTLTYYLTENLVRNHYSLGETLFEAKIRYTNNFWHNDYEPYHWTTNLFGDPSLLLEGYDLSAQGTNSTIYNGPVYAYGTDNDDNGDMYVAVSTQHEDEDGQIRVYLSTDHGESWELWTTVNHAAGIRTLDALVGRWQSGELASDRLHLFVGDTASEVWDYWIDLDNPAEKDRELVSGEGIDKQVSSIAAARDPGAMPWSLNLYVTWEVSWNAFPSYQVKGARSTLNGSTWTDAFVDAGYRQPHIDAGPDGHVYVTAVAADAPTNIYVKRSLDRGHAWELWENLTVSDGAVAHGAPVVAASTDAAFPTVWVAYNYHESYPGAADIRLAYSKDGGLNWTQDQILSAEWGVDERMPDMLGHRSGPSRWINITYDHATSARTNVVWRWVSGSTPGNWWAPRIMNDQDSQAEIGPQIIGSPGQPVTGSGVVYPGSGAPPTNLYFSAPWLTVTAGRTLPAVQGSAAVPSGPAATASQAPGTSLLPLLGASDWSFSAYPEQVHRFTSLAQAGDGTLYGASITAEVNEANTGAVYRSQDGGNTWQRTGPLPSAWWLHSLLLTQGGTLLAGGTAASGAERQGAVYRSLDAGEEWTVIGQWPETNVIHALLETRSGTLLAGTGPQGQLMVSSDGGDHWDPMAVLAGVNRIHALLEAADGALYAGVERATGSGAVYRYTAGGGWSETGALANSVAVYALLQDAGGVLHAGAGLADGTACTFHSADEGQTWEASAAVAGSRAVTALAEGLQGRLYAGVDVGPGLFTSHVYVSQDGGETWAQQGTLYMAETVRDLLLTPDGILYAASGNTYGVVLRTAAAVTAEYSVYLPLVMR